MVSVSKPKINTYTLYHATLVHTPSLGQLEFLPNTLLGVTDKGEIDFMEEYGPKQQETYGSPQHFFEARSSVTSYRFVDLCNSSFSFLFPGFVDTHIHASQYPNIGIGCELPLLDWLQEHTFPLESRFTDGSEGATKFAREIYTKVITKTLNNGTTCASYFTTIDTHTTKLFADLVAQMGQRGLVGKVCMNHNTTFPTYAESPDECLDGMHELIEHCEALDSKHRHCCAPAMVKPIVTPRFAPVCSSGFMKRLGALSQAHNLPIQTHIAENLDEIKLVHRTFPDSKNYTSVYDDHDLLGPSTILAHGIHLDAHERNLISDKQASISHCPSSNSFLTSGEAPIKQYIYKDNINVSLGTDLSGGFEQSILGVARSSVIVSHHLSMGEASDERLSVADALYMATMGGAKACGFGNKLGSFEKGKYFDAQLIDLHSAGSNIDVFDFQKPVVGESDYVQKMSSLVNRWLFSGDDRNCIKVWCNGKLVVDKADAW